ncbi:hypothetical protein DFH09DRAFT_1077965 [Mycena vulgaris]|nr:hypothetical protein DFH09DRAFT_1077965 [Mycena vulgaris]
MRNLARDMEEWWVKSSWGGQHLQARAQIFQVFIIPVIRAPAERERLSSIKTTTTCNEKSRHGRDQRRRSDAWWGCMREIVGRATAVGRVGEGEGDSCGGEVGRGGFRRYFLPGGGDMRRDALHELVTVDSEWGQRKSASRPSSICGVNPTSLHSKILGKCMQIEPHFAALKNSGWEYVVWWNKLLADVVNGAEKECIESEFNLWGHELGLWRKIQAELNVSED